MQTLTLGLSSRRDRTSKNMWFSALLVCVYGSFAAAQTTNLPTTTAQPSVQGQFFRVVTFEEAPFSVKSTVNNVTTWRGFCVDLLEALSTKLQFSYNLTEASDGLEGTLHADTGWTGTVGDIVDGRADMIVAALTITSHREDVIDFTKPYMEYGIGMLSKKPDVHGSYNFWAFLSPFKLEVWLAIFGCALGVAILIFLMGVMRNKLTRGALNDDDVNLGTTMWLSVGWITGDIAVPGAMSIRVLALAWGIFTLVVINTYTANLAASLTVSSLKTSINSPDDLIGQTAVTYGIEEDTALHSFLQDQDGLGTTYDKIWTQIQTHQDGLQHSLDEAVAKVREGNYVFIHDGPFVEYTVIHDEANGCELMMLGNTFLHRSYAIGLPHSSPYTERLTISVLEMKENGEIEELTTKWWPTTGCDLHGGSTATGSGDGHEIAEFFGILSILGMGAGAALVVAAGEIVWYNMRQKKKRVSPPTKEETQEEMIRRVVKECLREAKTEVYKLEDT